MNKMLSASFNQDSTCFSFSAEDGFSVYNCDPPTERFSRIDGKGIGIVEMLFRSNIFALVGGGDKPKQPINILMIWDDFQNKCIAELEFRSPITGVRLRRDSILVTIKDKAYLYNFTDLRLLESYDIAEDDRCIAALAHTGDTIVALPGIVPGTVNVHNLKTGNKLAIEAHSNKLAAMAVSTDGTYLATASQRGTIIRVWDLHKGELFREFRRGLEVVTVSSLSFDMCTSRLVVCSDKGTVHVYNLIKTEENRRSNLSYISEYLPSYFSSEWSSVTFDVPKGSICTFSNTDINTVYAITPNGRFLKWRFDSQTGKGSFEDSVELL